MDPFTQWTVTRLRSWSSDERGGIVGVNGGGVEEGGAIPAALVYDSASGPLVVSDRDGDVDAPEISRWASRLAHAWDQQNIRLMFSDVDVREPRMMFHRDVHDRLRMVAPFFWQSSHLTPIVWRDSLYWAVHLYSATAYYPLSEHTRLGGEDVSYVRHAATAIVQAHSGHVTLVADSALDPIAATWVRQFLGILELESVPAGGGNEHSRHRSRAPWRRQRRSRASACVPSHRRRRTCLHHSAVTLVRGRVAPARTSRRPDSRLSWTTPVLDAADRVRGLIVSVRRAAARDILVSTRGAAVRWPAVIERLSRVPEAPVPPREVSMRRGPVHVVPLRGGTAALLCRRRTRGARTLRPPLRAWPFTVPVQRAIQSRSAPRLPTPSECEQSRRTPTRSRSHRLISVSA